MVASENRFVSPRMVTWGAMRCEESGSLPATSTFAASWAPATGARFLKFLEDFGAVELVRAGPDRVAEVGQLLQVADLLWGHVAGHHISQHRDHIDDVIRRERVPGEIF